MIYYIRTTELDRVYSSSLWDKYNFINYAYYVVKSKKSILYMIYNFDIGCIILQENNKLYGLS